MASEKLFGNSIPPACQYCKQAFQQVGENILCLKHGVMVQDYSCKHFSYDPIKRIPPRPQPLEKYKEEDFAL